MRWKKRKTFFQTPAFRRGAVVALILALAVAFVGPRAKRRYDRWSASKRVERATAALARQDYKRAILDARSVLKINHGNLGAMTVMAKSLDAMGAPEAIAWHRRIDSFTPGNAENLLAWAQAALRAGDPSGAGQVLGNVKPSDRGTAHYHDLAAQVAAAKNDVAGAEAHWLEATKLAPDDVKYRLNLAAMQVRSKTPETRTGALEALKKLSANPDTRLMAFRTMLVDALRHQDGRRARELAESLASDPQATFGDKLKRVATLRALKHPQSASLLTDLREAAAKPEEIHELLTWMNDNDLALMVAEWAASLPADMVSKPPVCMAVADALAKSLDWQKLKDSVANASWAEMDFLRSAYLSRAMGKLDDAPGAAAAWNDALITAEKNPRTLEMLAKKVAGWGWEEKSEEALWKLASKDRCPRWALDALWSAALKRRDTPKLYRAAKLMAIDDPLNVETRNDSIFLGLLTRTKEGELHERAEALHKEVPGNANIASTYGLSLYQRGRVKEAVALMETYTPEQLRHPIVARYYGIFLAAAKQPDKAREFLELGAGGFLLAEEKALMTGAKAASSDEAATFLRQLNEAATSGPAKLAKQVTWLNGQGMAPLVSDWAGGLAPGNASKPEACVVIAESHALALEWKRLKEMTDGASWGNLDYLRGAFLARALDRLDDPAAGAAWQASLAAAEKIPGALERLAKTVVAWGWENKAGELLWKLSASPGCPRWVIDSLWDTSLKSGNSSQLMRAAKLMEGSVPKSARTRNSAIAHALLTHSNETAVREFAESLHKEFPDDVTVAAIHALSLQQQRRMKEAFAIMDLFTPEQLKEPRAALYCGIFFTASKNPDEAKEYLELAGTRSLTAEERALLARVKSGAPTAAPVPKPAN